MPDCSVAQTGYMVVSETVSSKNNQTLSLTNDLFLDYLLQTKQHRISIATVLCVLRGRFFLDSRRLKQLNRHVLAQEIVAKELRAQI